MKKSLLGKLTLAAVLVLTVIGVNEGAKLYGKSNSTVAKLAAKVKQEVELIQSLSNGCISRGVKDPNVAIVIAMTGGQICTQAMGALIEQEKTKDGICSSGDTDCLFVLGYSATSLLLGTELETEEQISTLESEAKEALRVYKEEQ